MNDHVIIFVLQASQNFFFSSNTRYIKLSEKDYPLERTIQEPTCLHERRWEEGRYLLVSKQLSFLKNYLHHENIYVGFKNRNLKKF